MSPYDSEPGYDNPGHPGMNREQEDIEVLSDPEPSQYGVHFETHTTQAQYFAKSPISNKHSGKVDAHIRAAAHQMAFITGSSPTGKNFAPVNAGNFHNILN